MQAMQINSNRKQSKKKIGVYCLILYLPKNKTMQIGKLGKIEFKKGYYCYVGSAFNNLDKRINRHRKTTRNSSKKLKWHIDYLREHCRIINVFYVVVDKKQNNLEDVLSNKIKEISNTSIDKFGASDSKCKSHLHYFVNNPTILVAKVVQKLKNQKKK